jgi:(p)ppGpp synthase/HD superfamily hydrolase
MNFHLRVYDNFHYSDESETDDIGNFASYEEALDAAKAIVDNFLISNWKIGITPNDLLGLYDDFGSDPSIISKDSIKYEHFSARNYAISRVEELCKKLELQNNNVQTLYQAALKFASAKHAQKDQKVPGTDLPYVVHLSNVAMEILIACSNTPDFNIGFAVQAALLHDTIEDTKTDFQELENNFGIEIAKAVSALSKNNTLPKDQQMQDSLNRIKALQKEVWSVKLADRITNLQPPPSHWDNAKKLKYQKEARTILTELKGGNEFLAKRLEAKIKEYNKYLAVNQTF